MSVPIGSVESPIAGGGRVTAIRGRFQWHVVVFLAPAVLVYSAFMVFPLLDTLRLSLFTIDAAGVTIFAGLDNYAILLTDPLWSPQFTGALANNVVFFVIHMVVQNPIGLGLALLLTQRVLRGRSIYRAAIFAPTVLSVVIIGFVWKLILSPSWGVAEGALKAVGLGELFAPWLGLESTALATVSLMSVWQWVGIPMLLFSAALLGIPDEILEAARVDGAGPWRTFLRIQLPLIAPTVGIVAILTFVGNFNAFDLIYAVQGALAGPNFSTDILGTFFYRTFFGFQLQLGNPIMGATVAGAMFLIILLGVSLYLFGLQRRLQRYEA
ncbi:MAG: ABC transporter permease [Chloroflexi bacterium 13_1_40CM_4_68_4]|nr:MAG: ABC transporter permease [Chloroflexi bacterium 13_1_40CM_4_68_4]